MNGSSSTSNSIPISDEAFNLASLSKEANQDRQQIFTSIILPSPNLHPAALASQLESFITELSNSPPPKGPSGYIWNRESPLISLTKSNFVSISFRVSDAIEDEWFITYILIQASKHFNGMVLNVKDQDGQFLLIEAADELPNWLTPDNAENRLWIHNGELHLIDPSIWSLSNTNLTEEIAASLVRDPTKSTLASKKVSEAALARIKDYPLAASDNSQRSLVFLPNKVARVILSDPQLIAPISEAICTRDAISSRAFQRMIHFPPLQTPDPNPNSTSTSTTQPQSSQIDELPTLVSIRLTRRIYAQLMAQRFYPPKIFGRRWQSNVENYRALMDSTISVSEDELSSKEREERKRAREEGKWWDLGCKLSCGLEMLYSQEKALDSRRPRTVRPNESKDPRNSSSYESFLSSLSKMGYFGSEMQGSARWKQLESEAVEKWEALNVAQSKDEDESEKQSANAGIVKRIDSILSSPDSSILPSIDPRQPLSILNESQDSDDWLTLSAEDLEEMLSSNAPDANGRLGNSEEDLEQQTTEQLKSFASKMEDFVNAQGDLEGARFNDEKSDDEEEDELDEDADSNGEKMNLDDEDDMEMDDEIMEEGDEKTKEKEEEEALRKAQKKLADLSTQEREAATSQLISSLKQHEWGAKNSESAKRAADMAKKMAAESLKETTSQSSRDRSNQMEMDVDQSRNEDEEEVANEKNPSGEVSSDTSASLRGLGGNQHFDGDSDEEESLDADDDTAEEKADRAAWLGLDDPSPNPTIPSNSSLASSIQGFGGRSDVPEPEADIGEEEEVEGSMQTEMDGFLEFSRRALGLSDEHYARILSERSARGAYIPSKPEPSNQPNVSNPKSSSKGSVSRSTPLDIPEATISPASRQKSAQSSSQSTSSASNKGKAPSLNKSAPISTLEEREKARERADQTLAEAEESANRRKAERRNMQQQQAPNPNINSFEQLMQAMETELGNERKNRQNGKSNGSQPPFNSSQSFDFTRSNASNTTSQKPPSKPTPRSFTQEQDSMVVDSDDSDSDLDELTAQDTELLKSLLSSDSEGSLASLPNVGGGVDANGNPNEDQINLISNFLESFKAQGGDAGPVGNLAKRLGVRLPRDDGN